MAADYSQRKWTTPRFVILMWCCTIVVHHHLLLQANSQQLVSTESQSSEANRGFLGHHHNQQVSTSLRTTGQSAQKIGLAPHDRPSCQLPIVTQRRHLSHTSAPDQTLIGNEMIEPLQLNSNNITSVQAQRLDTAQTSGVISSPSVVSLISNNNNSNNNKPAAANIIRRFDSSERLRQLRQLLNSNNYDAYLVTPNDEHGSEYVSEYDRRLRFISGFTGSNGYALILLDRAVLFTDGRYAIQADQDLDCNWWLVVSDEPLVDIHLWLKANAAKGIKIATDARFMSLQSFDYLDDQIKKLDSEFALISQDLVDVVWNNQASDSPLGVPARLPPQDPIFIHPLQFAGNVTWQEKLLRLVDSMSKLRARHYVISQLDDIAWLLNLRGNDIPMSPLFKAYLFISRVGGGDSSPQSAASVREMSTTRAGQQVPTSVEHLLASASGSQQQQQQSPLQSPQVLQVQPSQTIKVTMYVDVKKLDQQVRNHLHVDNGTIVTQQQVVVQPTTRTWAELPLEQQQQQQQSSPTTIPTQSQTITTRIQVELKDYEVFILDIRDKLAPNSGNRQLQGKLLLNAGANVAIHVLAKAYDDRQVLVESLINKLKAVKSDGEVHGMRLAHWRDSLAISMLLAQLDADIGTKGLINKWTEISAAQELEFYRSLMDHNKGQSFDTISAYGSNAAIVHYKPNEQERRPIGNQSTYLLDSGGQYLDGTTDITRTMHYGEPSDFQRETYTRVLMGAVDMMSLIFDQSHRSPYRLNDLLARRHLFELGLDYMHGTGHGIGLYSLVHEAPALIEHYTSVANQRQANTMSGSNNKSPLVYSEPVLLQANMFTSVEPGYYKADDFGIRLENIVVTQRVNLPSSLSRPNDRQTSKEQVTGTSGGVGGKSAANQERQFLRFEPISLVPFEPKLIKHELLSNKQKAWLNSYNLMVRLRMTQQINYYLAKIRNLQGSAQVPVQVHGTASSSRLYQQLLMQQQQQSNRGFSTSSFNNNNLTKSGVDPLNQIQFGYYNFLRLEGGQLQEKLEQTHRWIMSKTELIPLDVPQALIATNGGVAQHQQSSATSGGQPVHSFRSSGGSSRRGEAQTRDSGSQGVQESSGTGGMNLDGQRLMLAYMSTMPFNDQEAGEAVASFGRHSAHLSGRIENATSGGGPLLASNHNKCSGFECDLWLVNAMNPQQRAQHNINQHNNVKPPQRSWPEVEHLDPEDPDQFTGFSSSSLVDLFQLRGSNQGISINMWSIVVLGMLVVLQLSIMTYICRSGKFRSTNLCSAPIDSSHHEQSVAA